MDVYYAHPEDIGNGIITITGDEVHHIARVMRKSPGDEILVTAGQGIMFRAVIESITRDSVVCRIETEMRDFHELPREVVLIQGLLKNPGRMDFIVEKATELGVGRILPVKSRYTVAKGGKVGRWRSIALAAMKQCGRCRLPHVEEITTIAQAFESTDGLRIVCYEQEDVARHLEQQLTKYIPATGPVVIVIGPEGGFSDEELASFREQGAVFASLGTRRLRGETAALAALARTAAFLEQSTIAMGNENVV